MTITQEKTDACLTLFPVGSINTQTAPVFEKAVQDALKESKNIVIDFAQVDYVSSSGLRVLLLASNALNGNLVVKHVSPEIMEVLEMTGFSSLLKVE
jgi:anti-anti-sigma factor